MISMVRELEALGSAMSSHPLNTLSQRYSVYKKKRNDVGKIKNILLEKAVESELLMNDYLSFADDTSSGAINSSLMDIKSNYCAKANMSEFDLIKDFLESSNQGQTYAQSEQLREELENSILQQQNIVAAAFEVLLQYHNVVAYYPHDHVMNHRFAKYSQWCRSLASNKSQEFIRQAAIACRSTFGDAMMKEQIPENVIGFGYQLQKFLAEANYQRELSLQHCQQLVEHAELSRNFLEFKAEFSDFTRASSSDMAFSGCEITKIVKRLLTIEAMAFGTSGEHMADLIVNERWYIDEMRIQTGFMSSISDVVFDCASLKRNSLFSNSLESFQSVTEAFDVFHRVKHDFQITVIPLALKGIISGEKSVLHMISSLSNIQNVMPLHELSLKLMEDLHNCIHIPNQNGLSRAADLTEAYNGMVAQYEAMQDDNLGKRIFLSLHGSFIEVSKAVKKVLSFDKALATLPDEWSDIEEIKQSKVMFISPIKTSICMTLEQIFLVKRIQTMIEFFSGCLQIAWAFKGSGVIVNFDMEFLTRPLKYYLSECLRKFVLGRGSYSMAILVCCLTSKKKEEGKGASKCFSLDQMCFMTSANSKFCGKFFTALEGQFRKEEAFEFFKKEAQKQTEYAKQLTNILSAHHWLHEEYFIAYQNVLPPIPRAALLIQLQSFIQTFSNWSSSIQKINDELKQCTTVVLQRLKWASGANPMVNELMKNFETISTAKAMQFKKGQAYAARALKHSHAVFTYEMLRFKTPETVRSDEEFLSFLHQWESVCVAEKNIAFSVTPIEEALVELLDPEGLVERPWINNITSLIDDMINQVHSDIDENEKIATSARDNLDECAHRLRGCIAAHHRISADIRNLLKSILKHDDSDHNKALKDYLMKYKTFIDSIQEMHGNVLSKDFTDTMVRRTIEQADTSLAIINEIYDDLFTFEKSVSSAMTNTSQRRLMRNQSDGSSIEYPGSPAKKGKLAGIKMRQKPAS